MTTLEKQLKPFVDKAQEMLAERLAAVVLYGSHLWGYTEAKSDFDVFVLLKKKGEADEELLASLKRAFPNVNIVYFRTLEETKEKIKDGSWAQYLVLQKASLPIYSTPEFKKFLLRLKNFEINPTKIAEKYREETNPFDIKALKERTGGWDTNKWAALSIWKRLQILTYYQTGKLETDFRKSLKNAKNILTEEEYVWAEKLRQRLWQRSKRWQQGDRKKSLALLTKLADLVEEGLSHLVPKGK